MPAPVHDQSGELQGRSGSVSGTAADRFLQWQYPLHRGLVPGLAGRILVCLMGLLTASLCLSGLLLWWTRRRAMLRSLESALP